MTAPSGHASRAIPNCIPIDAATASLAFWNAAQNASPTVLKTVPPLDSITRRSSSSCRSSATLIASGWSCQSRVLPSMSVNRNVTVPVGKPLISVSRM